MRFSITLSITSRGRPLSRATRSSRAGSKAISPFMGGQAMLALRPFSPSSAASSSMHSWSIMVESMSAISIFLRRPSASCTATSTGAPARVSRRRVSAASVSSPGFRAMSQARFSPSQSIALASSAFMAIVATSGVSARFAGWEMSVATRDMVLSGVLGGGHAE